MTDRDAQVALIRNAEEIPLTPEMLKREQGSNAFTRETRELIQDKVAIDRLKGMTFRDIAAKHGVSLRTAYVGYKAVEERWREDSKEALDKIMAKELAKLDLIEAEAWKAWERSQASSNDTLQELTVDGEGRRKVTGVKARRKDQVGDARYLDVVFKCVDRRLRLLGLDAEEGSVAIGGGDGNGSVNDPLASRLARYRNSPQFNVVLVGRQDGAAFGQHSGEPVDSERPAPEAGRILDVDGYVR